MKISRELHHLNLNVQTHNPTSATTCTDLWQTASGSATQPSWERGCESPSRSTRFRGTCTTMWELLPSVALVASHDVHGEEGRGEGQSTVEDRDWDFPPFTPLRNGVSRVCALKSAPEPSLRGSMRFIRLSLASVDGSYVLPPANKELEICATFHSVCASGA